MVNKKLVDINGLLRYHEKLKNVLDAKQDNIDDLDVIRSGAAAGATALQSVPAEYVTETELNDKGYATTTQVDAKQDIISDLDAIRSGAAAGATALQSVPAEYVTETELTGKGYATTTQVDTKQDIISDLDTIRSGAAAGATALDDAKSYVDGKDSAMDARVKVLEAIDHDKLASDAAASAVATVLDGAPDKFDTLKEVAQWISDSESAASAADLVTRVGALEAIDHDAYVDADTKVLQDAKDYVDGKGYATTTQVDAKQDIISDLDAIRSGAAAGATALQSVPAEYVTETELTGKGYLTESDFQFAEDSDIDALFLS